MHSFRVWFLLRCWYHFYRNENGGWLEDLAFNFFSIFLDFMCSPNFQNAVYLETRRAIYITIIREREKESKNKKESKQNNETFSFSFTAIVFWYVPAKANVCICITAWICEKRPYRLCLHTYPIFTCGKHKHLHRVWELTYSSLFSVASVMFTTFCRHTLHCASVTLFFPSFSVCSFFFLSSSISI